MTAARFRILDKEYQVACKPEEEMDLLRAARYLDEKMSEIKRSGKIVGADRIAVMAALNITYDLLNAQNSAATVTKTADDAFKGINNKLDNALANLKQLEI